MCAFACSAQILGKVGRILVDLYRAWDGGDWGSDLGAAGRPDPGAAGRPANREIKALCGYDTYMVATNGAFG